MRFDRVVARLDDACFVREHHRLDAVTQAQLHQHVRNVGLHGRLADKQRRADFLIALAVGESLLLEHNRPALRRLTDHVRGA